MSQLHPKNKDIYFRTFDMKNSEYDAEKQAELYNLATKTLPGPNSQNATKESILSRINLPFFDPAGIIYAIERSSETFLAYCQSIQITESIIRIGYPWSLPFISEHIKEKLFTKIISFYKGKFPDRTLEFEIYTIDYRWWNEILWLEKHGIKFLCYWLWPILNLSEVNFALLKGNFESIEAEEKDFQLFQNLLNDNDDIKRFRSVDISHREKFFKSLLKVTNRHFFLKEKDDIVSFITIVYPQEKDELVSFNSFLVKKHSFEIVYGQQTLSLAIKISKNAGYSKFNAWLKENSIFHQCLSPYLENEVKWFHGLRQT